MVTLKKEEINIIVVVRKFAILTLVKAIATTTLS
jgi:hypothetical protein